MVKTFKNFLLQNWECLGAESLHKSLGMRGLPNLLKELSYVDIWPFYGGVKFASLCICMSPIHLNGKIVENFKFLFLWSSWAKFAQISYCAFLSQGHERLLKWSRSIDQDGHHAHNMVRPFKNLLLQNWGCLGAKSVHKSSGTGDLPKLLKRLSYVDIWPFYGKVVCFPMHLYEPHNIYMGKLLRIWRLLWSIWAKFAQIFSSPEHEVLMLSYCGQSMSVVHHGSCGVRHAAWTIALKAYSSYTPGLIDSILGRKHQGDM